MYSQATALKLVQRSALDIGKEFVGQDRRVPSVSEVHWLRECQRS
jgi:hypothetical protein